MSLHTRLVGTGRPAVVFLHGLFGRGQNWTGIARDLAAHDLAGVLFDLPNHGRSHWTERFDYAAMADEVADELDLRLGSAAATSVVGHSMGGKVAMLLALRHPGKVTSLVVIDIAPADSAGVRGTVGLLRALRELDLSGLTDRSQAEAALADDIPDAAVRALLLQNLHHRRGHPRWHWQFNLNLLGSSLDAIAGWPDVTGLSYPGPVLWVRGERSDYVRPEHLAPMQALFPDLRQVTIGGAGHWVHGDQPEALAATLVEFLSPR